MPGLFPDQRHQSLPNSTTNPSFLQFSSSKFRLIAIFALFFLGLVLSYLVPLSQPDIEPSNRDKIIVLICLNVAFFLAFAITIMKAGSSSKFFRFKDKSIAILTLGTLVLNLELFWVDQQPDISSFFVLITMAMLPSILYISLVDKIVHWALLLGYLGVVYVRTNSDLLGFLVTLDVLIAIMLYVLLKREVQNESWKKLANHELMTKVFNLSSMHAEKSYMVVNKDLELVFANEYFYKFFELDVKSTTRDRVIEIFKEVVKVSCVEKLVEIIEDKESDYEKKPTMKPSAKNDYVEQNFFKRSGTTKGQTIKSYLGEGFDDSLKTATMLFFEYSDVLKDVSIGWNNEQKAPMMFPAVACYEMQKYFLQFAYINADCEDLVLIEIACNQDLHGFASSPSNLSMTDIASIIHEIRTPLNGTIFLIQQTIENQSVPPEVKEDFLVPCLVSSKRLSYVVNDILDFAQILEGKFRLTMETFNLTSTLLQSLQILEALARSKGLETYLHIDPNIPQNITTDQNRLIQIIYNLMGNAIKFTKEGYIKLSVALSVEEPRYIDFLVEDTGYGIKQEDLKKLFKVFEKLDNWHDNKIGCGLGLSIGNALAKALGKNITVESEYKKGSRFKFSIENREKILGASNRNLEINTRRSHMTMENSARLHDFEPIERKSRMFSFEEGHLGSTVIPSIFESPKMKPNFTRKESNEIRSETPNTTKIRTVHFDFNHPSTHSGPVSAKQNEIYHIKVDPGIDEALKEEEDTIDFGLINRSNSGVPFLKGKGETSNQSLLSPGVRNLCQCIKVLGVDDEPINTFSLQLTLKEFGLRAKFFSRGDDLIEYVVDNQEQLSCGSCKGPYFILMDCYMPIKDGFETTDELIKAMNRRKVGRIPIIACTADESDVVELKIKQHGMSERVAKPVTKAQFETLIQKYNFKQQYGELEEIKEKQLLSQETD